MAAIETSTPQLSVVGPGVSGGGHTRRRYYSRDATSGHATTTHSDPETLDPPVPGRSSQQQQPQPTPRQKNRRPRGSRGDVRTASLPVAHHLPVEGQIQLNDTGRLTPASKGSRQRFRRGRSGNGPSNGNQVVERSPQLNWQQQLLLENTQQHTQNYRPQRGATRDDRGDVGTRGRQSRHRRQAQGGSTTALQSMSAPRDEGSTFGRIPTRGFGAQLTESEPTPEASSSILRPEASVFEPGAAIHGDVHGVVLATESSDPGNWVMNEHLPTPSSRPRRKVIQTAKTVKEAEDLTSRIHSGISSGTYECMICYAGITRKSQVWDCGRCYAVFHIKCIQKWARQGLDSALPQGTLENGEDRRKTWRCPGCQNPESELPTVYACWCGKTQNPDVQRYIAPHSCGQPCGKERIFPRACAHPCNIQCHAGPCPPCIAMGPTQACYCGKQTTQRRCLDTDYEHGWSCLQICGDYMPCGEHTCPRPCHSSMCGDCEFEEESYCYCGKKSQELKCCDKSPAIKSLETTENGTREWMGLWSCKTECKRPFDCGNHKCSRFCHPPDPTPAHCPLSPDMITHCPCGKTKLTEVLSAPRQSCQDPIPSCGKTCNKTLKCGHTCQKTCHTGDCGICLQTVQLPCRCGKTVSTSTCHQGDAPELPQCMLTCRVMLNCLRHECGEKCCSGGSKATERLAALKKKKPRLLGLTTNRPDEGYEPEHICTRPCGKPLKCGKHNCPMLCHRGPCGTCLEASFEELSCHCGQTVIQPPVPCGSRPPQCAHECTREKHCGHPVIPHNCHEDEEPCPNCPYFMVKRCACGKKDVKYQFCWREAVTCGTICGKRLSCGSHTCKKICHREGECDNPCTQPCGKPKSCGHTCSDPCHAPFQCSEATPCESKLHISCACGGIKQEVRCNITKSSTGNRMKELKCNDSCRARRMAFALQIDPERDTSAQMGYSEATIEMYHEQSKHFTQTIEKSLRAFAEAPQKRFAFRPMGVQLRHFIHSLAADFGLESESQDPEPHRSVVVMKGPKFMTAPKKTIAEFIRSPVKSSTFSTHTPMPTPTPAIGQLRKIGKQAVNAIVLEGIRVGLLMDELEKELKPILGTSQLKFKIHWTGDEEVILEPKPNSSGTCDIDLELSNIKPALRKAIKAKCLAQDVELCLVGKDGRIASREDQKWAVVTGANKGSSSSNMPAWGGRPGVAIAQNGFAALDSLNVPRMVALGTNRSSESLKEKERKEKERKEKEKRKQEQEIVDDWEIAADEEEARSHAAESLKDESVAEGRTAEEKEAVNQVTHAPVIIATCITSDGEGASVVTSK